MKKRLQGNVTIEATYIIPLILLVVGVVFHVLFYYHDKNILHATAHETAAYGAGSREADENLLESYFISEVKGKLLLFTNLENEVCIGDENVTVICHAVKSKMSLRVECSVGRTEPEKYIRNVRKIKKIGEGIGKQN